MLTSIPQIPWPYRAFNHFGTRLGVERWKSFRFEAGRLFEEAASRSGLTDFGDKWFSEGLQVFLDSLEADARLSPIGRKGIRGMVVTLLQNRLLFVEARQQSPERFETPLNRPVIILGLPRSGTTFLHRLLAMDPRFRTLPMWQLFRPIRRESPEVGRRVLEKALAMRRRLTPDLDSKHVSRADLPEECIWLLNFTFVSHGLWVVAPVYRYLDWLSSQDRFRAYLEYGALLRFLQSEEPSARLLLKAPNHSGSVPAILHAIPDACLVQMHRDPAEVVSSLNSLFYSVFSAVVESLDVGRMARANLDLLAAEMERNLEARRRWPERFIDVHHSELVADPLSAVREVYRRLGLEWTDFLENRIVAFLESNPRHKHGVHHHGLDDFGLSVNEVERRFQPYPGRGDTVEKFR